MHIQIFLGRFLAARDSGTDFLAENFRPAAGERIQSGSFEFNQRLLDGLFREPRKMENFNRGETFEMQSRGSSRRKRL